MSASPPTSSPSTMSGGSPASPAPSSARSGTTPSPLSSPGAGNSSEQRLLLTAGAQHVAVAGEALEHHVDHRMLNRPVLGIGQEILLRYVGFVGPALRVLRQQMIKGLFL